MAEQAVNVNKAMDPIRLIPDADWRVHERWMQSPAAQSIMKSVAAGGGVDPTTPGGSGRAMMYESLEPQLISTTLEEEHARIWRLMPKRTVAATIDQYAVRSSLGSRWGLARSETGIAPGATATIARMYDEMAFYQSIRGITHIANMVHMVENPQAEEEQAGMLTLVHAIDEDMYHGVKAAFPNRINGLFAKFAVDATIPCYNMDGNLLLDHSPFDAIAAAVHNKGGRVDNSFLNSVLAADVAAIYQSAERITLNVAPDGRVYAGKNFAGVETAFGKIDFQFDPFNKVGETCPAAAEYAEGETPPALPASVTPTIAGADGMIPIGNYYYKVRAVLEVGASAPQSSAVAAITTGGTPASPIGEHVSLAIADPGSGATPTGYMIYRSAKNAADATDCRFMCTIARTGATTTWVDTGFWVPGTAHVPLLDMAEGHRVIQWSQLCPAYKHPLPETAALIPFDVNLNGVLRLAKPTWCGWVRNILPQYTKDNGWNPLVV